MQIVEHEHDLKQFFNISGGREGGGSVVSRLAAGVPAVRQDVGMKPGDGWMLGMPVRVGRMRSRHACRLASGRTDRRRAWWCEAIRHAPPHSVHA